MTTETSSPENDLTVDKKIKQENPEGSSEPDSEQGLPEGAKNWQHAIQQAREREEALKAKLADATRIANELKEAEKKKKLAEMSEVDQYKSSLEEEMAKRGKLELQIVVKDILAGKKIPAAIRELIEKAPWAIPAVQDELGSQFTWDDCIDAVKRYLPQYAESLEVKDDSKPSEETVPNKVDSERSVDVPVIKDHVYTREEVEEISKDPDAYEKHRTAILKQMAKSGGVLPSRR